MNPVAVLPENTSSNTSQPEVSISAITDVGSSPSGEKKPLPENETPYISNVGLKITSLDESKPEEGVNSNMCHRNGLCYSLERGHHVTNECGEELCFPDRLANSLDVIVETARAQNENTGDNSREPVSSEESVNEKTSGINATLDSIDSSPSQLLPNDEDWAPATSGEVTSSELIHSADREQPDMITHQPIIIDRNVIQDLEKDNNTEFFMGRPLKTPERYMKIRNYILDMWEKTKPNFLFKTAVRSGLRNCGDVNSIGRVHAFLEDIGAINEGCLDRPVPRVRQQGEVTEAKENVHMESWVNSLRPRKKRQRNADGDWVDPSKAEGMTIQVSFTFSLKIIVLLKRDGTSYISHLSAAKCKQIK